MGDRDLRDSSLLKMINIDRSLIGHNINVIYKCLDNNVINGIYIHRQIYNIKLIDPF